MKAKAADRAFRAASAPSPPALDAAARTFQTQWQTGEGIARNLWGPSLAAPEQEVLQDASGGYRLVQYYNKGRMELTDTKGGTVTNGLLANELITGQVQIGNDAFQSRDPAAIPIAGDADNPGPTYAALNGRAAHLLAPTPSKVGMTVTASVFASGDVSEGAATDSRCTYRRQSRYDLPPMTR